jgi:hypothetical protein
VEGYWANHQLTEAFLAGVRVQSVVYLYIKGKVTMIDFGDKQNEMI